MSAKQGVFLGIIVAFLVLGVVSMKRAMPNAKEDRIYKALKVYSPYTLEKRMGGLTIVDKRDGRKEKPSAAEVLLRLDELDKEWGVKHLQIQGDTLQVLSDNNQSIAEIFIQTKEEKLWLKNFFGI